jgi:hypothetical protein
MKSERPQRETLNPLGAFPIGTFRKLLPITAPRRLEVLLTGLPATGERTTSQKYSSILRQSRGKWLRSGNCEAFENAESELLAVFSGL